jgi:hypothetical protein
MNGRTIGNLILMTFVCVVIFVVFVAIRPAPAGGAMIPTEYRGEWCMTTGHPYYTPKAQIEIIRRMDPDVGCGRDSDGWIKITADRYDGWEQQCRPFAIKTDEIKAHVIKFRCQLDGEVETRTVRFVTTTGTKGIGMRLYVEEMER